MRRRSVRMLCIRRARRRRWRRGARDSTYDGVRDWRTWVPPGFGVDGVILWTARVVAPILEFRRSDTLEASRGHSTAEVFPCRVRYRQPARDGRGRARRAALAEQTDQAPGARPRLHAVRPHIARPPAHGGGTRFPT